MTAINVIHRAEDDQFNFNTYQVVAGQFATYPGNDTALGVLYCTLKLTGEAGELSENVGKALRDDGFMNGLYYDAGEVQDYGMPLTTARHTAIVKELGDVLWYVARLAGELGLPLSEIARINLEKLQDRAQRNVLQGSGDNR